jgi:hypothetical protein
MMSEDSVEQFKDAFLRGDYDFGQKDQKVTPQG